MNITVNTKKSNISQEEINSLRFGAISALDKLWSGQEPMTGWVQSPIKIREEELSYLLDVADIVREEAELFLVIGIGGSYLGAKAAIEALPKVERGIEVKFLGINFCSDYYYEIMEEVKNKKTILCVVSKSGNTMEISAAFETIKPLLVEKYKSEAEAAKRIIAITDPKNGALRREAEEKGYITMDIPSDIGGRYSVFTPAGLLPMAVSGIDVRALIEGASIMATSPDWDVDGTDYAIVRHFLQQKGKHIEVLEFSNHRLKYFGEWVKQLFGESEGKAGQGLWPATLMLSTDLHSMGQYLQEGRQNFMETVITVDKSYAEIVVPSGPLAGKSMDELNLAMLAGVAKAHSDIGIPIVEIHIPELDANNYGQLLYFFETTCAITAMVAGVDPFDQPGVEAYKEEMRKLLQEK